MLTSEQPYLLSTWHRSHQNDISLESSLNRDADGAAGVAHVKVLRLDLPAWCMNRLTFWSRQTGKIESDIAMYAEALLDNKLLEDLPERMHIDPSVNLSELHTPPIYSYLQSSNAYSARV